jgi:ion channel-forming bestrophin family protein
MKSDDKFSFWFSAVTTFHKTKVLKILFLSLVVVGVYTWALIYSEHLLNIDFKPDKAIFSLLGIVLGLLLVFRTNTAYERWWEGRKLLGQLVNNSRNFAIKLNSFLPESDVKSRKFFEIMIPNYAFAMKEHLREGVILEELEETDDIKRESFRQSPHIPNRIASLIIQKTNQLYKQGSITNEQMLILDKHSEVFTDIVGGCERIKNTPIPFSYRVHLKKFIFLYTMILPFGFIHDLGYWTVPVIIIIFYAFVGLEVIGEEIEDPFGRDANDLPTDQISQKIRKNVKEIMEGK